MGDSNKSGMYIPVIIPTVSGEGRIVGKASQIETTDGIGVLIEVEPGSVLDEFINSHKPLTISISGFANEEIPERQAGL